MKSKILVFFLFVCILPVFAGGASEDQNSIVLWTNEGESEQALDWLNTLAARFEEQTGFALEIVSKDTEALREDYISASIAGAPPDFLWTVNDHAGPFKTAGLLDVVNDMYDADVFVDTVTFNGDAYAVPISAGNHLMLLYNKNLISSAPNDVNEFIDAAESITGDGVYGLVYNQIEPFWLVPWLGGFGGQVFAEDGVTPTLNTSAMVDTLAFLSDLKTVYGIVPEESDYGTADTLFKEGKAGFIVNGDWSLSDYVSVFGDDLGIAPLPMINKTGEYPAPYTSGKYFMVTAGLAEEKRELIKEFIAYALSAEVQEEMVSAFKRLPARKSVLDSPLVADDPILASSGKQMSYGTPMPSVIEMRAVWDAIKPEMNAVLFSGKSPNDAARAMQETAEAGIQNLQ